MSMSREDQERSKKVKEIIILAIAKAEHVEALEALKIIEPYLKYATAGTYLADGDMILNAQKKHIERLAAELSMIARHYTAQLTDISNVSDDSPQSHQNVAAAFDNISAVIMNDLFKTADHMHLIALKRWIEVLKTCMKNRDYHSAAGIFTALNVGAIDRLKSLMALLSPQEKDYLTALKEWFLADQGWGLMEKSYSENKDFIPTFPGVKKTATKLSEIKKTRKLEASYLKEQAEKQSHQLPSAAAAADSSSNNTAPSAKSITPRLLAEQAKSVSRKTIGKRSGIGLPAQADAAATPAIPKDIVFEHITDLISNLNNQPMLEVTALTKFQRQLLGHTDLNQPAPNTADLGIQKIHIIESTSYQTASDLDLTSIPTSIAYFKEDIKKILQSIKHSKKLPEPSKTVKKELEKTGRKISPDAKIKTLHDMFEEILQDTLNTGMHTKLQSLKMLIATLESIKKSKETKKDSTKYQPEQINHIIEKLVEIQMLATRYDRLLKLSKQSTISHASTGTIRSATSSGSHMTASDFLIATQESPVKNTSNGKHTRHRLAESQRKLERTLSQEMSIPKPAPLKRAQSAQDLYSGIGIEARIELITKYSLLDKGIRTPHGASSPNKLKTSSSELEQAVTQAFSSAIETPNDSIKSQAASTSSASLAAASPRSTDTLAAPSSTAAAAYNAAPTPHPSSPLRRKGITGSDKGEGLPLKGSKIRYEATNIKSSSGSGFYARQTTPPATPTTSVTSSPPNKLQKK